MLGDLQYNFDMIDEAIASYAKVSELSPEIPEIWLDYSDAYFEIGEHEKAIEIINQGLEENDKNVSYIYRLAAYLFKTGKDSQALIHLEDALSTNYEKHQELEDYDPELMKDSRIISLIKLYSIKD
jgi:tetratricopeptide (TPR) repeat protein